MLNPNHKHIYSNIILQNPQTAFELHQLKRKACRENKISMIKNSDLLEAYVELIEQKKCSEDPKLFKLLKKRAIRTLSGVAPIAVLTKPHPCPGTCIFCPDEKEMPKSYLSNEPAVMRAIMTHFDPYRQVEARIRALQKNGHDTDKVELIVMGGTWSYLPHDYQENFIKRCFDACNGFESANLEESQKVNETASNRIVGLTLETRPDYLDLEEIKRMRYFGCTKVEIGVQAVDDKILELNKRGVSVKQIKEGTRLLKDAGFKVCYHIMPNLPGSSPQKDLAMYTELFSNPDFRPDMLKIYPCVVNENAKLFKYFKRGEYQPYTDLELEELLTRMKLATPEYVRIIRLIRDIPEESIAAGNKITNLRQIIKEKMAKKNLHCACIRCREAREKTVDENNLKFSVIEYQASNGKEYFLQYTSKDKKTLYAFLRLRIPGQTDLPELAGAALIRELHTYGQLTPLAKNSTKSVQHLGLGKKLLQKAEKIVKQHNINKTAVISGIGVREYYRKRAYKQEFSYMIKNAEEY